VKYLAKFRHFLSEKGFDGVAVAMGGVGIVLGVLIFYAIYAGVNTDAWDSTVITMVELLPLGMVIGGLVLIFKGIRSQG